MNKIATISFFAKDKGGLAQWNYLDLMPQLVSVFITTLFMMIVAIQYNRQIKDFKNQHEPRGLVLIVEIIVKAIEKMIIEILGIRYKKLTVYFLFLLVYLITGNMFGILGIESFVSSYTVVLSLGLVSFFGIYYFGLKYQKLSFFKKYLTNPLELISQFIPLISMTFRLFGNVIGGSIIIGLIYQLLGFIWSHVPIFGPVDLLALVVAPFIHIYFDIFDGSIQAYIFSILTLIYWKTEMHSTKDNIKNKHKLNEDDLTRKNINQKINNNKKLKLSKKENKENI